MNIKTEPKGDEQYGEVFDMLSKVQVNLPLLNVIKKVPAYGNFFKNLITKRRRFTKDAQVEVSQAASVALQQGLPPKLEDSGSFMIDITMGDN